MSAESARRFSLLLAVGLLLGSFFILLRTIAALHMQPDETLTYVTTNRSFLDALYFTEFKDVHAPLWFVLAWTWQQFTGLSEFAGRVQSALFALLTMSIVYRIGRDEFRRYEAGMFALALLATNAFFVVYTLEIRPYPLVMLVTALSYRYFLLWIRKRTRSHALLYGLTLALLLYTHYYLLFVLLSQVIGFFMFRLRDRQLWIQGIMAGALGAALLIPQILVLRHQLTFVRFTQGGTQGVPTQPTTLHTVTELFSLASNGWLLLLVPLILAGLLRLWKHPTFQLSLMWLLVAPGMLLLANLRTPLFTTRYISFMAPALSLVVGLALAVWLPHTKNWRRPAIWLGVIALCAANLYSLPSFVPQRVPFRDLFTQVNHLMQPDDVLLLQHHREDNFLEDQYSRYLAPELRANRVFSLEEAQAARRVWFVSDMIFDAAYEPLFDSLESSHRVMRVIGDCTRAWCYVIQLMQAPPMREPVYFGETIGFLGTDLEPLEDRQLSALLWWEVGQPPQADYSISLQLLREDGSLISQVDRQIQPPDALDVIPTSAMQPGGNYIDWRVLEIPPDVPAGRYRLQVVVYQWWDGQRLPLLDGSDSYLLDTLEIGTE